MFNNVFIMILHINEIKLEGDDKFTKTFNKCSEYWTKAFNESLSDDERKKNFELWFEERQRLEFGIY